MTKSTFIAIAGFIVAGSALAQEVPPFSFNVGAGFVEPQRSFGRYTDAGWNVQGGAGFNFNPWLSAMLNANFNNMGINRSTLDIFGAPGGTVQIWSFTVDPVVHLTAHRRFDVYVTGGGGIYRREDQLTTPVGGFDPFFGPYFGNQVLASYSVNKPGWDLGAGINLGSKWRAKFYAEARYNRMFTNNGITDYIPVTFGIRF